MYRNGIKKLLGFTLSEVLITVALLAVVASLTIPGVVSSYQKRETVTKLKKEYLMFNEVLDKAMMKYGPITRWDSIKTNRDAEGFYNKYLKPYLIVLKDCGYSSTGECDMKAKFLNDPSQFTDFNDNSNGYYKVILQDGSAIIFQYTYKSSLIFLLVYFDINGIKGPNTYGRDVFMYGLYINNGDYSGKFVPNAYSPTADRNNYITNAKNGCSKEASGKHCSGLIMADGWQIKDDYPW